MSLTKLFGKLRQRGFKNYRQFLFCVTVAITLITSFALMLDTSVVQNTLPIGGDSRKQVMLIFMIAIIGCFVFTLYAASLFLKYKSREIGVFLVLGTKKKHLSRTLYQEITILVASCLMLGLVLGTGIAFLIWQLFAVTLFRHASPMSFNLTASGVLIGIVFGVSVYLALIIQAYLFMKKTKLMAILHAQRMNEPLPVPTKAYGMSGLLLLVAGVVLGYGGPQVLALFGKLMPGIWNVVYLLAVIGLYRILVYTVGYHQRGRNPQTYYRGLINASLLKFQGKQTVRNMLICGLLLSAGLFAMFYTSQLGTSVNSFSTSPVDFALHYPEAEGTIEREQLAQLAADHHVELTDYQEVSLAELVVSGIWRDWDDAGNLLEDYHETYQLADVLPVSLFNEITGQDERVSQGQYSRVIAPEIKENFFEKYADINQLTNPVTAEKLPVTYAGTIEYQPLVNNGNFRIVLNDDDYALISQGLTAAEHNKQLLFNTKESTQSFAFSEALYQLFLDQSSKKMAVSKQYDTVEKEWTLADGNEYDYEYQLKLTADNSELMEEWKYYPVLKPYAEQTFFKNFAVFFLVFIYIAVICLIAVAVISYTRCLAVGQSNKLVFTDLRKLGANQQFIATILVKQLRKIYVMPTIIAFLLVSLFTFAMLVGNDGQLSSTEVKALAIDGLITVFVFGWQYAIYRVSLKKVKAVIRE